MALTYSQINAITEKHFVPKLVDNVYASNALLSVLDKEMIDGGEKIIAPIISSTPSSGHFYSGFDTLNVTPTDNISAAEFDWKMLFEPIKISGLQELQNAGDAAKLKLVASKMMVAEKNFKENLAVGLFSDGTAATGELSAA